MDVGGCKLTFWDLGGQVRKLMLECSTCTDGTVLRYYGITIAFGGEYRYFLYHTLTCPLHTNSGCGKSEAHINWSMVIPEKIAPVTGNTLRSTGPIPADSRQ